MLIKKNKASGKYFIHLRDAGNDESLLILPEDDKEEVKIRSLKNELFTDEPIEGEEEKLVNDDFITQRQKERYDEYKKSRSEENVENLYYYWEQMTPYQRKKFLEKQMRGGD